MGGLMREGVFRKGMYYQRVVTIIYIHKVLCWFVYFFNYLFGLTIHKNYRTDLHAGFLQNYQNFPEKVLRS